MAAISDCLQHPDPANKCRLASAAGDDRHQAAAWPPVSGEYSLFIKVENLEVDVSHLVEDWISGDLSNYGFGVRLTADDETEEQSYYTKMFFARGKMQYVDGII